MSNEQSSVYASTRSDKRTNKSRNIQEWEAYPFKGRDIVEDYEVLSAFTTI